MKKIYTLIFGIILAAPVVKSQSITLTKTANEPSIGDFERRKSYDTTVAVPRNTGTNQTWNFTSLATSTVAQVTYSYVAPATVPTSTAYTGCTIVRTDGSNNEFFKSTTTQYELLGSKQSSVTLTFTNSAVNAVWPIAYSYTNTDTYGGTAKITSTITLNGPVSGNINTNASGTGTLQLPNGITLNNCLQVKSDLLGVASFSIPFIGSLTATLATTSYQYYHSSYKYPVLTVNTTAITTPTASFNSKTTSVSVNNDVFSGINEYTIDNLVTVYPNPTSDYFQVEFTNNESTKIEIYNQLGQVLITEIVPASGRQINISSLNSGVYFLRATVGNKTSIKKLIKE